MRVTNNIITNQFLTNNNRLLTQQIKSENRIATQRRFNRVSEDPINGSKAMTIRRQLRNLDIQNETLSSVKALFSAAEINLLSITDREYISVEERLTASVNTTYSQEELDIFATELDEIAEQMVKDLNSDFSERQIFGGASNGKTPFQIQKVKIEDNNGNVVFPPDYNKYYDENGALKEGVMPDDIPRIVTYNGVPLDFDVTNDIILPDGTICTPKAGEGVSYKVSVLDEKTREWKEETTEISAENVDKAITDKDNSLVYPGSKPIYVDIGLGIKYNDEYEVDPQTALDISLNGAEITGNGIDMDRVKTTDVTERKATGAAGYVTSSSFRDGFDTVSFAVIDITVDGTQVYAYVDNTNLPEKTDGTTYTNDEIISTVNNAVADAYKAKTGEELPADVNFSLGADNNFVVESKDTELTLGANNLGIAEGDVPVVNAGKVAAKDENGNVDLSERFSKNLVQLVMDAADSLRRGDQDRVNAIIDRANEANNHILTEITTLGTKQNSIEFYQTKNDDYEFTLKERQNLVEGTDMEDEIINYEAIKAAYDATLKMGSQILPHSIFDFI